MSERPLIIVAGGEEDERRQIVRQIFEAFEINTRTDGRGPRVHAFDGDPGGIIYPSGCVTSW